MLNKGHALICDSVTFDKISGQYDEDLRKLEDDFYEAKSSTDKNCICTFYLKIQNEQTFSDYLNNECESVFIPSEKDKRNSALYAKINASHFFKNNEYFGPVVVGETFFGQQLHPKIIYEIMSEDGQKKIQLSAGYFIQQNFGNSNLQSQPTFSATYSQKNFTAIIGNLNGGPYHQLATQLYSIETGLTNLMENGAQIIFHDKKQQRYFSDTWIEWKNQTYPGSTEQEHFRAGSSNRYEIPMNKRNKLQLIGQVYFDHHGGQVNIANASGQRPPTITLVNYALGANLQRNLNRQNNKNSFLNKAQVGVTQFGFSGSPNGRGQGVEIHAGVESKVLDLYLSHWQGNHFDSFAGTPYYSSFSKNPNEPNKVIEKTNFIKLRASKSINLLSKDAIRRAQLSPYLEYIFDKNAKTNPYTYGLVFQWKIISTGKK